MKNPKENAKEVLNHYFQVAGVNSHSDNTIEIKGIVDNIIKATKEEIEGEVKNNLIDTSDLTVDDLFNNMSNEVERDIKKDITHNQLIDRAIEIEGELGDFEFYTDEFGNTYSGFRAWKISSNPKVATLIDADNIIKYGEVKDIRETESEEETDFYNLLNIKIRKMFALNKEKVERYNQNLESKEVWVTLAKEVLDELNETIEKEMELMKEYDIENYNMENDNNLAIGRVVDVAKDMFQELYQLNKNVD